MDSKLIMEEDDYSSDENDMDEIIDQNNIDLNDFYKTYGKNKQKYISQPVLTKYEKTRIISERVQQLSNGAIPYLKDPSSYPNIYDIALNELSNKKLPFIIKRGISSGNFELWKLEDLEIIN
tara:strand:- start:221 stop:586 length:366 start_codon:yes stop_codon:yes gene_type:complete